MNAPPSPSTVEAGYGPVVSFARKVLRLVASTKVVFDRPPRDLLGDLPQSFRRATR